MTPERAAEIRAGLSVGVIKGIELLKSTSRNIVVGGHRSYDCPISTGHSVGAASRWRNLDQIDREVLESAGWIEAVYDEFVKWYDQDCFFENSARLLPTKPLVVLEREDFLRFELSQAAK